MTAIFIIYSDDSKADVYHFIFGELSTSRRWPNKW